MPELQITRSGVGPVTVGELRQAVNLEETETHDDDLLRFYLGAAVEHCEEIARRAFIEQDVVWQLDAFPRGNGCLELPRPPLISITSIEYVDGDGADQTLAASEYKVDAIADPGRVVPAYGKSWPTTRVEIAAVTITYKAGYQRDAAAVPVDRRAVPEKYKQAVRLLAAHWYRHREPEVVGRIVSGEVGTMLKQILLGDRVVWF